MRLCTRMLNLQYLLFTVKRNISFLFFYILSSCILFFFVLFCFTFLTIFLFLQQCLERSAGTQTHQEEGVPASLPPCPVTSGPPPAYESLIFNPRALPSPTDKKDESDDPGSILSPPVSNLPSESEANRINKREDVPRDDQGLPSYEAALKLEADGYV